MSATLARSIWLGAAVAADDVSDATDAFVELERRFEAEHRYEERELAVVRASAARSLARFASAGGGSSAFRQALRLDPLLPAHVAALRVRRRSLLRSVGRDAVDLLRALAAAPDAPPIRVAAVFPEPTPYRAPLLDRVAALPEIDLTVLYAAGTVAGARGGSSPSTARPSSAACAFPVPSGCSTTTIRSPRASSAH